MGLWEARPKIHLWVFKVQVVQKKRRIKEKDAYKKRERAGDKKISIKKHKFTSS
jgi:hypothetical protein